MKVTIELEERCNNETIAIGDGHSHGYISELRLECSCSTLNLGPDELDQLISALVGFQRKFATS